MQHRDDIDGLRALAVLPVVLFHLQLGPFVGGYVGVDVFFVISGFLITSIIAREIEGGRFSLLRFYERRIRRIAPAGFAVVAAVMLVGWFVLPASSFEDMSISTLFYNLYATNLLFWQQAGYFDTAAEMKPLLHTWSLSVEEQFYIFFPLFLLLAHRWGRRYWVAIVAGVATGSFLLNCYAVYRWPSSDFYLIPFRAWELAIGSLLAMAKPLWFSQGGRAATVTTAGIGMIIGATLLFDDGTRFPGVAAVIPCLGAAMVIAAGIGDQSNLVGRLLANPLLRYIGLISYSLYLWHWPVLVFARYLYYPHSIGTADKLLLLVIMLLLSHLSWRWIETPFRERKVAATQGSIYRFFAAATVMLLLAGLLGYTQNGLPDRMPQEAIALDAGNLDFNHQREVCHGGDGKQIAIKDYCVYGAPDAAPTYALWGDSHGAELAPAIGSRLARAGNAIKTFTYSQCPSALNFSTARRNGCVTHNTQVLEYLVSHPEISTVYLVANYHVYSTSTYRAQFQAGFHEATNKLLNSGKRVVVFDPVPTSELRYSLPTMAAAIVMRGDSSQQASIPRQFYDSMNADMLAFLATESANGRLVRVRPESVLCDDSSCRIADGSQSLYFDGGHLSMYGATKVVAALSPALLLPPESVSGSEKVAWISTEESARAATSLIAGSSVPVQ